MTDNYLSDLENTIKRMEITYRLGTLFYEYSTNDF